MTIGIITSGANSTLPKPKGESKNAYYMRCLKQPQATSILISEVSPIITSTYLFEALQPRSLH